MRSTTALLALTLVACKPPAAPVNTADPPPAAAAATPEAEAAQIFAGRCSPCHGATGAGDGAASAALTEAQFARAREIYFNRCAGCHGTLRAGATGPALTPERMIARGTNFLRSIISSGTDRGMPGWVRTGLMTREEAELLALYVQLPAPTPPQRPLADIRASWQLRTPVALPTAAPAP